MDTYFRKRLGLLMGAGVLVLLCGLACFRYTQAGTLDALGRGMEKEFDEKVQLRSASLNTFVNDYSYWDDMVAFLASGSRSWAATNIDTCIPSFEADAIWIRRADFTPAYAVTGARSAELKALPVPQAAEKKLFAGSRFCHFFARCPDGLLEVYGATIHPTNDSARKTEPKGYLLAGRVWTKDYVEKIASLTGSTITLSVPGGNEKAARSDYAQGKIVFTKSLADFEGKPLLYARVSMNAPVMAEVVRAQRRQLYTLALLSAGILGLLYLLLVRWMHRPLHRLTEGIGAEDSESLSELHDSRGEFGFIARRLSDVLAQKQRLADELAEHKRAQDALRAENERLRNRAYELSARLAASAGDGIAPADAMIKEIADLKSAYSELDENFKKRTEELHTANELLQNEIVRENRQHKAELVKAIYERKQVEAALLSHQETLKELKSELTRARELLDCRDGAGTQGLVHELAGTRSGLEN